MAQSTGNENVLDGVEPPGYAADRLNFFSTALSWLPISILFIVPFMTAKPGHGALVGTAATTILFALIYVAATFYQPRWLALYVAAMTALGIVSANFNYGWGFLVVCALLTAGKIRPRYRSLICMILIGAAVILFGFQLNTAPVFLAMYLLVGVVSGLVVMIQWERERRDNELARVHEELRALAVVAERERISRDLHDLLGHTLTLVAVKAELASRLISSRADQAEREINEVANAAREALSEVRTAVAGMRGASLALQLDQARDVLNTAGIHADIVVEGEALNPQCEAVLAMAVREAVTNIIRHADASCCKIRLGVAKRGAIKLTVEDNGRGNICKEGSGLSGMRTRLAAVGGSLDIKSVNEGSSLTILIPYKMQS